MKRQLYVLQWVLSGILIFATGCGQASKQPETVTVVSGTRTETGPRLAEKYNEYLMLMDEQERAEFFKLETEAERDRFLQSQGINRKKYLEDNLAVGMPKAKVSAIKDMNSPIKTQGYTGPKGRTDEWIYDVFNGYRRERYVVEFRNNKVADWKVMLP